MGVAIAAGLFDGLGDVGRLGLLLGGRWGAPMGPELSRYIYIYIYTNM